MIPGGRLHGPEASAPKEKRTRRELKLRLWKGLRSERMGYQLARSMGQENGFIEIPKTNVALA